jgi:hypothetical protein
MASVYTQEGGPVAVWIISSKIWPCFKTRKILEWEQNVTIGPDGARN